MMKEAIFHWEENKKGGVRILRGYGTSPFVVIPEKIEGLPVEELGDYCFADSEKAQELSDIPEDMHVLSGKYIQRVTIPDTVKKIGNLSFFRCGNLLEIEFGATLGEIGSDAFMNCFHLKKLVVRASMLEKTGLKAVLNQRKSDTLVEFQKDGQVDSRVFFPEYAEGYDLIGPAHIFALSLTGEGFRARESFQNGVFLPEQYDNVFDQARAEESEKTLCIMAWNRLCFSIGLSEKAKKDYEEYLMEHVGCLADIFLAERNQEALVILFSGKLYQEELFQNTIRRAAEAGWTEGAALLMGCRRPIEKKTVRERYTFDDF